VIVATVRRLHTQKRSLQRRMDAPKRANEIRTERAKLIRGLKGGSHGACGDAAQSARLPTAKVFDCCWRCRNTVGPQMRQEVAE
jgi:hypothetical protein